MKPIFYILLLFFVTSCTGFVDDSDEICVENCTLFEGRIINSQGNGIANVDVSLRFYGYSFGYERLAAKTTTNADGYYTLNGDLKEISDKRSNAQRYNIEVDTASLNLALFGKEVFLRPADLVHDGYFLIDDYSVELAQKDTTVQIPNFIVPSKSSVFVTLNNFVPDSTNSFSITNQINYGFDSEWGLSTLGVHRAYAETSTFVVKTKIGLNIISVTRHKNGIWEKTVDSIYVENSPSNITLDYDF